MLYLIKSQSINRGSGMKSCMLFESLVTTVHAHTHTPTHVYTYTHLQWECSREELSRALGCLPRFLSPLYMVSMEHKPGKPRGCGDKYRSGHGLGGSEREY